MFNYKKLLGFYAFVCCLTVGFHYLLAQTVAIINTKTLSWGGIGSHSAVLYEGLKQLGYDVVMVADPATECAKGFVRRHIPVSSAQELGIIVRQKNMYGEKVVLICNKQNDFDIAKNLKKSGCNVVMLFCLHIEQKPTPEQLSGADAAIAVNPDLVQALVKLNNDYSLGIKTIEYIPPVVDGTKFLSYTPTAAKDEFFIKNFGLSLAPVPLACMIGNLYKDVMNKNHPLLFEALRKVIYEKKKNIEVLIVGDGMMRPHFERVVKVRGLDKNVHFLGSTDLIPEILYHADMHILSSSKETFGIVTVEAGFMGKPAIGAFQTGAELIIKDGQTGLLFRNYDAQDLADKIEFLIDHPDVGVTMGTCAREHVKDEFSAQRLCRRYEKIFSNVLAYGCASNKS